MLKQLFTAAALVATTATAGLADLRHESIHMNGCFYTVNAEYVDAQKDVSVRTWEMCDPDATTGTYARETRTDFWVRCNDGGRTWLAVKQPGGGTWEEVIPNSGGEFIADVACTALFEHLFAN